MRPRLAANLAALPAMTAGAPRDRGPANAQFAGDGAQALAEPEPGDNSRIIDILVRGAADLGGRGARRLVAGNLRV